MTAHTGETLAPIFVLVYADAASEKSIAGRGTRR